MYICTGHEYPVHVRIGFQPSNVCLCLVHTRVASPRTIALHPTLPRTSKSAARRCVCVTHSEFTPSLFKFEPHHRPLHMAYPHTNNDPSPATQQTRGHGTTAAKPGKSRAIRTMPSETQSQGSASCVGRAYTRLQCGILSVVNRNLQSSTETSNFKRDIAAPAAPLTSPHITSVDVFEHPNVCSVACLYC